VAVELAKLQLALRLAALLKLSGEQPVARWLLVLELVCLVELAAGLAAGLELVVEQVVGLAAELSLLLSKLLGLLLSLSLLLSKLLGLLLSL
jgi:hypothetical protein